MTDREKAIVMAHTGICMLAGDKFQIFHKYVEDIMHRPIMVHEMAWLEDSIKEMSKADFMALCNDESVEKVEQKTGYWCSWRPEDDVWKTICSECGEETRTIWDYCPHCGTKMIKEIERRTKDEAYN